MEGAVAQRDHFFAAPTHIERAPARRAGDRRRFGAFAGNQNCRHHVSTDAPTATVFCVGSVFYLSLCTWFVMLMYYLSAKVESVTGFQRAIGVASLTSMVLWCVAGWMAAWTSFRFYRTSDKDDVGLTPFHVFDRGRIPWRRFGAPRSCYWRGRDGDRPVRIDQASMDTKVDTAVSLGRSRWRLK